ncbi:MAG: MATE family efflux transporter [Pseudomonadota bacterium]
MASEAGRFTTGSTMRHVAVMTLTGSLGLSFMFLIDFATLFYISLLEDETLTAGVGFAWAVQFFTISIGIGMAIGTMALVSRAIGALDKPRARRIATAATLMTVAALAAAAVVVLIFRAPILGLIEASGPSREIADRFLLISVPSLPFVGMAMITSSILRAEGDARRSMMVTMAGGLAAMVLDPLLIFGLDLGVDGAAYAIVLSRMISAGIGLMYCIRAHDLMARPRLGDIPEHARPYLAIALPAIATQLSTPVGNFILTRAVAEYGDSAVAGWAVATRLTVLAFGGIFALSGAVGGIFGQNYGAKLPDRIRMAYRDSLIFALGYVIVTWTLLMIMAPFIADWFGLSGVGADVLISFCYIGGGGFVFAGMLFVANAAFNNLGHPLWSTAFNWTRDAAAIPLVLLVIGASLGATGPVWAQALAALSVGLIAVIVGWRLANNVTFAEGEQRPGAIPAAPVSGKAANAVLLNEDRVD